MIFRNRTFLYYILFLFIVILYVQTTLSNIYFKIYYIYNIYWDPLETSGEGQRTDAVRTSTYLKITSYVLVRTIKIAS